MSRFRIYVRDKSDIVNAEMPLLGEIDTYTGFTAINRHNAVGSWTLKMPAGVEQTSLIAPGRGIVVFRGDDLNYPVFSGPIKQIDRSWSKDAAGAGTLSVSGVCDNAILRERVGRVTPRQDWPYEGHANNISVGDPGSPAWIPVVADTGGDRVPNNSAEFIYGLLVANFTVRVFFGDYDLSRSLLQLKMDGSPSTSIEALPNDDLWKGFPINMADLETTVFALAEAAGLAVRFQWQAKSKTDPLETEHNKVFVNITPIADLSNSVVFDPSAGNISSYNLSSVAPDATRVIIGGQVTEGARRWYSIRKNDFLDPVGWIDRDDRDSVGNRYSPTSDGIWGRQKIEVDWNTNAEMFLDSRDIVWEYQPTINDYLASSEPTPGSDIAVQVDQAATKALVENGPKGLLTMTAVDTPACTFGVDYFVSDVVRVLLDNSFLPESMRPEDGILREMVREVQLSSTASDIWTIQPTVGTSDSSPTPYIYKALAKLRAKVEDTASRTTLDPLSETRPNEPAMWIGTSSLIQGGGTGYCYTTRPVVGQKVQIQAYVLGGSSDPGWTTLEKSELQIDVRIGETGDWVRQANPLISTGFSPEYWYKDITMVGPVNAVMYVRSRLSVSGAVSDWAKPAIKFTAASGAINTSGTLTLNTPSGTHHVNALFNLTGTDNTNGHLSLQMEKPVGSGYKTLQTRPTYSGASGNTFSFSHLGPDNTGTYNVRVVSSSQWGLGMDLGTIYKTSNVVTINVV